MREELRHWLTMASARSSHLVQAGVKRPVLVVFNFHNITAEGFLQGGALSEAASSGGGGEGPSGVQEQPSRLLGGDPSLFIPRWKYKKYHVEEVVGAVEREFSSLFEFQPPVLWNGFDPLKGHVVCPLA